MRIRVGGVPEHFNFPFRKGLAENYFQSNGLQLEWNEFAGGTGAMLEALNNGSLDAATLLTEGAFKAISQGANLKVLKLYVKSPLIWGVHTASNNNVHPSQCEEIEFLISRPMSGSHLMAKLYAEKIEPSPKAIKFTTVDNLSGALQHFRHYSQPYFLWEKFTTHHFVSNGQLNRVDEMATPWPSFCLVVSDNFLSQALNTVQTFNTLLSNLIKALTASTQTLEEITTMYELEPDVAKAWYQDLEWETQEFSDLNPVFDALLKYKMLDKQSTINQFLP